MKKFFDCFFELFIVGDRQAVVETHCDRLRLLYRDCAKPPPPPSKLDSRAVSHSLIYKHSF